MTTIEQPSSVADSTEQTQHGHDIAETSRPTGGRWSVIAGYFTPEHVEQQNWLGGVQPGDHEVELLAREVPITNWHERKFKITMPNGWLRHWRHAVAAEKADTDGVITLFQHLPVILGARRRLRLSKKPVVAWMFTVPNYQVGPVRRWLVRQSLMGVDRLVIHNTAELEIYREWLDLPADKFEFVHYPVAASDIEAVVPENTDEPFVAALGSAHRDFPNFFQAVSELGLKTIVAAGRPALAGIDVPEGVETPFDITRADCHEIAHGGRVNVVPMKPKEGISAAGYVTIAEGMFMGRPMIVTDAYGAGDYVEDGVTGLLVEPNSAEALKDAIERLWSDPELRERLGANARAFADEYLSDRGAAAALARVLDDVLAEHRDDSATAWDVPAVR